MSLLSLSHCSALGCVHNSSVYFRVETNIPPNSQFLGVMAETMVVSAHIQTCVFNMHHTYRHICLICTTHTDTYYNIRLIHLLESFILRCRERIHFPFGDIVLAYYGEQRLVVGSYFTSELISSSEITILNYAIPLR